MWENLVTIIQNRLEPLIHKTFVSLKEQIQEAYLRILAALAATIVICSTIVAFIAKLAERLDAQEDYLWTPSMSLYIIILIVSCLILRLAFTGFTKAKTRLYNSVHRESVNRISQRRFYAPRSQSKRSKSTRTKRTRKN